MKSKKPEDLAKKLEEALDFYDEMLDVHGNDTNIPEVLELKLMLKYIALLLERLRHNKEFLEIKVELDNARKEIAELKNRLNSK